MSANAKTPDEIKTSLEYCTTKIKSIELKVCDLDCPYRVEGLWCRNALSHDTLAYIQQLEVDNARQARCIENLTDKLNATNDALPRWISVEERLPEKYSPVVIAYKDRWGDMVSGMGVISDRGTWFGCGISIEPKSVTHWMQLPQPPVEV